MLDRSGAPAVMVPRAATGDGNGDAISIDAHSSFWFAFVSCQERRESHLGDEFYHILNRSAGRMQMFRKEADFQAFERVTVEAHLREPLRIISYYFLANPWHSDYPVALC